MLISWSAKWFNWNAIRNNRTMLYVAAALIVILISVPVIVWRTGGMPEKDPGTVPLPTSVATQEATRKTETPAEAKKVKAPADAKKVKAPVVAKKAETPGKPAAPATVLLGIAPWGEVYVDGNKKGVSPPLNSLQVAPGKHQIEIRNTTFSPYKKTVDLKPGEQLKIKHKFR
jgi:hypothetical protein